MGLSLGGGIGPFRASVSTRGVRAGIGVSAGPVRYSKTLVRTGGQRRTAHYSAYSAPAPRRPDYDALLPSSDQVASTTGSHGGRSELTDYLNDAAAHRSGAIITSFPLYALAIATLVYVHPLVALLFLIAGVTVAILMFRRAAPCRVVDVSYALPIGYTTPEQLVAVERHRALVEAWPWLVRTSKVWRRTGNLELDSPYHQKLNAGANHLTTRELVTVSWARPRHLQLEEQIAIPSLKAGAQRLFFLPDRVLAYDSRNSRYYDVAYSALQVTTGTTEHTERETRNRPSDGHRTQDTWLRTNKNGTPDRRYAENYRIPVYRYSTLTLRSKSGLRWELLISRSGATATIAQVLTR